MRRDYWIRRSDFRILTRQNEWLTDNYAAMHMEFEHTFELPAEQLFAFHENPDNLALLLRDWPTFRMVRHAGHIRPGAVTQVQERIGLVWISMTFEHFLYEPPRRFAERLVRGPFRQFEHVHEFMPAGSRTILRDSLEVSLPWYLGGGLTMKLLVAPKLRRFFAYRHAELEQLLRIVPCSAVANREPRL